MSQFIRVKDIAEDLGIHQDKVLQWIRAGLLVAVNVVQDLNAKNARWRIRKEDYEAFLKLREHPAPAPKPAHKWKRPKGMIEYIK